MNKQLFGWTAALIAGVSIMSGCVTAPIPEVGHRIAIEHSGTSQAQPIPATAPAAKPRTAWYRVPDGVFVEEADCPLGSKRPVPDPAYPGWAVEHQCRLLVAQAAPAPTPAPAHTPAATAPAYVPPTTAAPAVVTPAACLRTVMFKDGPARVVAGLLQKDSAGQPICLTKISVRGCCPGHEVMFEPADAKAKRRGWQYHIVCPTLQKQC